MIYKDIPFTANVTVPHTYPSLTTTNVPRDPILMVAKARVKYCHRERILKVKTGFFVRFKGIFMRRICRLSGIMSSNSSR